MQSAWRAVLFSVQGWNHFMKSGYEPNAKNFDNACLSKDLTGQHCVVTGANQGIGYDTCRALAKRNAHVHMVCRNEAKGKVR